MLKDKVIVVTGGSGLLGKAIIEDLKFNGAIPINFDVLNDLFDTVFYECDITDDDSIKFSFSKLFKEFGKIDGLVNCAYPHTKDWGKNEFESLDINSWRVNVNWQLNGYVLCCQEAIKIMLNQRKGSIVNIASIYGIVGNDFGIYEGTDIIPPPEYSAIKGAIINFTRFLASFYGSRAIRVNSVSPGGIKNNQNSMFVSAYEKKVPLGRMGNPEDISPAVTFLLSDKSQYITGHNLVVDGGWTAI